MTLAALSLAARPLSEPVATAPHNLEAEQALLGAVLFDIPPTSG